jgi:hypothetical protein
MMNKLNVSQILSKNCGGYGAWIDNPLSSPAPGAGLWQGFQLGGGPRKRRHKYRKSRKSRKSDKFMKNNRHRKIKTRRH